MTAIDVHVVVIGAGLSGVATAVQLRQAGVEDFVVLEKSDRVGGTWRDNTYPGCGCDVPSVLYSYSFAPNPDWSRLFAGRREIQAYVERTAERFGVYDHLRLDTEVLEAAWSDDERRWLVKTADTLYAARFLVCAAGPLTEPALPDVPGIDTFGGEVFHSARWDHDVDLSGKRVAVVGTGASAVQFVPEIQPHVAELHLLQRTPSWVVPQPDVPISAPARALFRRAPVTQRLVRGAVDRILEGLTFALRHPALLRGLEPLGRAMLRAQVGDPELRAALTPDFTLGCKRLLLSNSYYRSLTRPNVSVIPHALTSVGEDHVVAADGTRRDVDVIIFGTGFDVSHPPIAARVRRGDGRTFAETWLASPEAYLGTTVSGVPNAFVLLGPNLLVYSSFIGIAEAQIGYVVDALEQMERAGAEVFDLRGEVQRDHNARVQRDLQRTVFNAGGCKSYYLDEHGRNFAAWPWSIAELRRRLARFDLDSYDTLPARERERVAA